MALGVEYILPLMLLLAGVQSAQVREPQASKKVVICYWESWAIYRLGDGASTLSIIDPHLCTHLIYAFATFGKDNCSITPQDPWCDLDICGIGGNNNYQNAVNLRKQNPDLKVLISIGGWNEASPRFSNMSSTQYTRQKFIASVIWFLVGYDFDGLDIDWEYPTQRGGSPDDKQHLTLLLQELRAAFDGVVRDPARGSLVLTAAFPGSLQKLQDGFELAKIAEAVHYMNVMTYDYHVYGDGPYLYHHSAMDSFASEDPVNRTRNVKSTIFFLLSNGVPANKIVMGIGAYGHTYHMESPTAFHIFDPVSGMGDPGQYTQTAGTLAYYEICAMLNKGGFNTEWNETIVAPFSYDGQIWISYDDLDSVIAKASYIVDEGLAGALVWAISQDDCRNLCGMGHCPITASIRQIFDSSP